MLLRFLFCILLFSYYIYALKCTSGSVTCSPDCFKIIECIAGEKYEIADCGKNLSICNSITKSCHLSGIDHYQAPGLCLNLIEVEVQCGPSEKAMPHPTDCTKYFDCKNNIKVKKVCENGRSFNPKTRKCDQNLNSNSCRKGLTPRCDETLLGQYGALTENEQIFWTCIYMNYKYEMRLLQCPDGKIFDKNLSDCYKPGEPSTIPFPPTETEFISLSSTPHECKGPGIYPDENDCHCMFLCSGYQKPAERVCCMNNRVFNPRIFGCEIGSC